MFSSCQDRLAEIQIEKEFYRSEGLKLLSKVVDKSLVNDFAKTLYYAWSENLLEAENIVEELYLYPIHFSALYGTDEEFESYLINEKENAYYA